MSRSKSRLGPAFAERRRALRGIIERIIDKDYDGDPADYAYAARILEALHALESFGAMPVTGGYLNQPVTFIRDVQAARSILLARRAAAIEAAQQVREAMSQTAHPDIPLPPIPKELI